MDTIDYYDKFFGLLMTGPKKEKPKMKNLCNKTRKISEPYEVWVRGSWTWLVLKKWQADDHKPFARWFCFVTSEHCPDGEYGDTYSAEIMRQAKRIK